MSTRKKIIPFFDRLVRIDSDDSDDARRRQVLNIILLGVIALTVILVSIILIYVMTQEQETGSGVQFIYPIAAGLLIGAGVIYLLNRFVRGGVASTVFLVFLVVIFNFSDTPEQVANGRSILLFCIPIILSSILLRPNMSFIFATIVSVDISLIAISYTAPPNFPAITVFFLLALASWLSASSLEQALRDLRRTNANLDNLVQERTRELARALARERVDAGRSKAILESIADGVVVFDVKGIATEVNPALLRLLEKTDADAEGMTIDELTSSKTLDARNRSILTGLLTNPGDQVSGYRINWNKKTLSVSSSQVHDTTGTHIGTVAVFRDFTREAEVERMKNTFLAVVSHELRTPLNAILGYAEMLKESIYGPINQKQERVSERIISNSHRLLGIINDLLDQAQMEAGKLTIQPQPFKPADLLESVHGVMDKLAADKSLPLTSDYDPDLPEWITGDPARLQQILINLINNSIKFTLVGSIHFRLLRQGRKHWAMEVRDTGIGIAEDQLDRIFETFHQVDGTTSREHGGFGLGLSIVKQLSNLMGGDVTVSSQLGKGSTFTVILPLVTPRKQVAK